MFCNKCGSEIKEDNKFCTNCGNKVIKDENDCYILFERMKQFYGCLVPIDIYLDGNRVGSVKSNLDVKVTSYGLNNALVELSIIAEITEQITLPHTSKEVKVSSSIPIVTELIQGKIPYYYQGGLEKNFNLS